MCEHIAQNVIGISVFRSIRKDGFQKITRCIILILCPLSQGVFRSSHVTLSVIFVKRCITVGIRDTDRAFPRRSIFVIRHAAERIGKGSPAVLAVIFAALAAAVSKDCPGQVSPLVILIRGAVAPLVCLRDQMPLGVILKRTLRAIRRDCAGLAAARIIFIGSKTSQAIRYSGKVSFSIVRIQCLAPLRVYHLCRAHPLIKPYLTDIPFPVRDNGMVLEIFQRVLCALRILLPDDAVPIIIFIAGLTGSGFVVPFDHPSLLIINIPYGITGFICCGYQIVSLIRIGQCCSVRFRNFCDMP